MENKINDQQEIPVAIDSEKMMTLLDILEQHPDEEEAVMLLGALTNGQKKLGQMVTNKDKSLNYEDWSSECKKLQSELNHIVKKIEGLI